MIEGLFRVIFRRKENVREANKAVYTKVIGGDCCYFSEGSGSQTRDNCRGEVEIASCHSPEAE